MKSWPVAELDAVARLRVLARALPWLAYSEVFVAASPEAVWSIAGDLEGHGHEYEIGLQRVEILERSADGERLRVRGVGPLGIPSDFAAVLRPGWCLMQNRFVRIGMATSPAPEASGAIFAHFEGSPVLRGLARGVFARKVRYEAERVKQLAEATVG